MILCSLGGWYVVISKYLEIKAMVKEKKPNDYPYVGQHIPGMGPPPVGDIPFHIPEDLLDEVNYNMRPEPPLYDPLPIIDHEIPEPPPGVITKPAKTPAPDKRYICNWASIIHVAGFGMVTGIPFVNVIVPTVIWLLKKEQHPFLMRQGREVINFQITYCLIQFLCLGAGAVFMWLMPMTAASLLAKTKIVRAVFSTSMFLPFNIFTVLPFFWACVVMIRGAVAAYHGLAYKYPLSQPFIFAGSLTTNQEATANQHMQPAS